MRWLAVICLLGAAARAEEDEDATIEAIARARDMADDEGDAQIAACHATPESPECLELRGRCDGIAARAGGQLLRMCDALGWTQPAHDTLDLDALAKALTDCRGRADDPFCARLAHTCFLGDKYGYYAEDDLEAYCKAGVPDLASTDRVRELIATLDERAGLSLKVARPPRIGPIDLIGVVRVASTLVGQSVRGWGLGLTFHAIGGERGHTSWAAGADVELIRLKEWHALGVVRGGAGTWGKWIAASLTAGIGVGGLAHTAVELPIELEFIFGHKHRVVAGVEVGPRLGSGDKHALFAAHAYWLLAAPGGVAIYVGAQGESMDGLTVGALVAGAAWSR